MLIHVLAICEGMDEHLYKAWHFFHGDKGKLYYIDCQILARLAETC